MENNEYNRLIRNNKLEELSEIWNISDFTRYKYLNKYVLEYLLEKGIHNTRMDNYAINDILWVKLYLKYKIVKPLEKCPLELLLVKNGDEPLLESLLKVMKTREKIRLYKHIKYEGYYLYHYMEQAIIDLFYKYDIIIPKTFLEYPTIINKDMLKKSKDDKLIQDFKNTYNDISPEILDYFISELYKKKSIDPKRPYYDIVQLIIKKKQNPDYKLGVKNINCFTEDYAFCDYNNLVINKYWSGNLTHEISHFEFANEDNDYSSFNKLIKNVYQKKSIEKITNYLNEFHDRFIETSKVFEKIYYKEAYEQFGGILNYFSIILLDIKYAKPDIINISLPEQIQIVTNNKTYFEITKEFIKEELVDFKTICTMNYYYEELSLENLLDALLKGGICDEKYDITSFSGHHEDYLTNTKDSILDECLANYEVIKYSRKRSYLIPKLRELVGNKIVDYLEDISNENRNLDNLDISKTKR